MKGRGKEGRGEEGREEKGRKGKEDPERFPSSKLATTPLKLWPPNSPTLNPVDYDIWAVTQRLLPHHRQIHSVDELKRRLISEGAVLNSRFLTRLLTSDEEDIERVSMLKKDISSTACELTMLILSTYLLHSV